MHCDARGCALSSRGRALVAGTRSRRGHVDAGAVCAHIYPYIHGMLGGEHTHAWTLAFSGLGVLEGDGLCTNRRHV